MRFPAPKQGYVYACLAVACAWFVLSWPWLSGSVTIPYDAKGHFQPQLQFLANALHSGQSPFWNPNVFVGSPHIADPQSLIFSAGWLLAYFDAAPSFRLVDSYVLTLLGLGALGIVMFFRDRNWHPGGATVAALAFAFGASAAWRIQHTGQIYSFALFPLCLWLLSRALNKTSLVYGILCGLAIALMTIEPNQVALFGCFMLAGFALDHYLQQQNPLKALKATALPLTLGACLCIALVALPLIFTALYAGSSNRPAVSFDYAGTGSLPPASLFTALVGDLYGALNNKVEYWGPGWGDWNPDGLVFAQNFGQLYVGAIPIIAILTFGITRGLLWAREIRLFTIAGVLFILYALGWYTPIFKVFYDYIPGVNVFRRPADATFAIGATLAILGGYLVHRLLSGTIPAAKQWQRWFEGGLLAVLFAACVAIAISAGKLQEASWPLVIALGYTAGALFVFTLAKRFRTQSAGLISAGLAVFMVADLAVNNGPNESTGLDPVEYEVLTPTSKDPAIKVLKANIENKENSARRDRVEMVGLGFAWPNASMVHGFEHTLGYNPLRLAEVEKALGAGDTIAEPSQRTFSPLFPSYRSKLADLLGLRYIASGVPVETIDKSLKPGDLNLIAHTPNDIFIYENPKALPRVLFAKDWRLANFEDLMKTGRWPDFDPLQTVLLERAPETVQVRLARPSQKQTSKASAVIRSYRNTEIEIEVDTSEAGLLVLNDVWHPWWFAQVDGKSTPILQANVLFRAVEVGAGKHIVRFEFKPITGAYASLMEKLYGKEKPRPPVPGDLIASPAKPRNTR